MYRLRALCLVIALLPIGIPLRAQEFRQLNRITAPGTAMRLPPGAIVVSSPRPVPAEAVEGAVRKFAMAWNNPSLVPLLAENFYDKSRLLGALASTVPRDALLRVVSIQGSQVLSQFTMSGPDGQQTLFSRVSVSVRTQVEYNDPQRGFQRLDGTNDYILLFRERMQ